MLKTVKILCLLGKQTSGTVCVVCHFTDSISQLAWNIKYWDSKLWLVHHRQLVPSLKHSWIKLILRLAATVVLTCNFITIGVSSDFKVCEIWQIGNLLQLLNLVQTQLWVEVEEQTAIQNAQILLAWLPVPEFLQVLIVQQHKWVPVHKQKNDDIYKSVHHSTLQVTKMYVHLHKQAEVWPHA